MNERDWRKLSKSIAQRNCILFLGPELPIEIDGSTTTLTAELIEKIRNEEKNLPSFMGSTNIQLSELTNYYLKLKTKQDLVNDILIEWYRENENGISSALFDVLKTLPFTFIIDTTPFDIFFNQLSRDTEKRPEHNYYNFKGKKIDFIRTPLSNDGLSIGNTKTPFIYSLYGSIEKEESVVISENDLLDFLTKIISRDPDLPKNIKAELCKKHKSFLFVGFGILAKSWYFKILLHALEFGNKEKPMSFAYDYFDIDYNNDSTAFFFKDSLHTTFYKFIPNESIEAIAQKYHSEIETLKDLEADIHSLVADAPTTFISYIGEDFLRAEEIANQLKSKGVNIWMDATDLRATIDERIKDAIMEGVNSFIVLQSKNMKNNPVNYVNAEIKIAEKKANKFSKLDDFIFSCIIDELVYQL
jgi:hypothetical protein